jgi:hypothetical protein
MAKRAKSVDSGGSVEGAIGGFAEDLGRILGQARNKADSWLGQRQAIVKQLTQLRDEASSLLNQLGHQAAAAGQRRRRVADSFVAGYQRRGPGRPKGSRNKRGIIIVSGKRRRRKMSAAARAKISAAQKARWAKQKAGQKRG